MRSWSPREEPGTWRELIWEKPGFTFHLLPMFYTPTTFSPANMKGIFLSQGKREGFKGLICRVWTVKPVVYYLQKSLHGREAGWPGLWQLRTGLCVGGDVHSLWRVGGSGHLGPGEGCAWEYQLGVGLDLALRTSGRSKKTSPERGGGEGGTRWWAEGAILNFLWNDKFTLITATAGEGSPTWRCCPKNPQSIPQ